MDLPIKILTEFAISEQERGNDSNFAKSLAYYIRNSKQIPTADNILGLIGSIPTEEVTPQHADMESDMRLKSLYVKGIRRFSDKGFFYRLDFTEKSGSPVSCVYVGRNGVGKTSLYHGLEMTMLGNLESISNIVMNAEEKASFLANIFSDKPETGMAIVETSSKTAKFSQLKYKLTENPPESVFPPACFCSGRDIELMMREGIPQEYVAKQLRFDNLRLLIERLQMAFNSFEAKRKELSRLNEAAAQRTVAINMPIFGSDSQTIDENKIELQKTQEEIHKLISIFPALSKSNDEVATFVRCKDYMIEYYKFILESLANDASKILNHLVSEFISKDIERTAITYSEPFSVAINITPRDPSAPNAIPERNVSPAFYLNNFRQKLFYVAFKAALYLFAREKSGINYPFVVDDIFDSSDFENRDKVKIFMKKLHSCDTAKDGSPNTALSQPIQVILFTHDDIIAEEAYKGILKSGAPAKFARIFEHTRLNSNDYTEYYRVLNLKGEIPEQYKTLKIEDEI